MELLIELLYSFLWEAIFSLSGLLLGCIILWSKHRGRKPILTVWEENDLEIIRLQAPNAFLTFLLAGLILLISLLLLGLLWVGLHKVFLA